MGKGYDAGIADDACTDRSIAPGIPLRETPAVKRADHKPTCCEHGEWRPAGADHQRKATKWRCATGECKHASVWIKADRLHSLIPHEMLRWKGLYCDRASVERAFGRLKHEWVLAPLRVRGAWHRERPRPPEVAARSRTLRRCVVGIRPRAFARQGVAIRTLGCLVAHSYTNDHTRRRRTFTGIPIGLALGRPLTEEARGDTHAT